MPNLQECSSIGRAPVSKTGGWGFEPLHSCQMKGQCIQSPIKPLSKLGRGFWEKNQNCLVYVTVKDEGAGLSIAQKVVEKRLAAYANLYSQIKSIFN